MSFAFLLRLSTEDVRMYFAGNGHYEATAVPNLALLLGTGAASSGSALPEAIACCQKIEQYHAFRSTLTVPCASPGQA